MRSVRERGEDNDLTVPSVDGIGDLVRDDPLERDELGIALGVDRSDETQEVAHDLRIRHDVALPADPVHVAQVIAGLLAHHELRGLLIVHIVVEAVGIL